MAVLWVFRKANTCTYAHGRPQEFLWEVKVFVGAKFLSWRGNTFLHKLAIHNHRTRDNF